MCGIQITKKETSNKIKHRGVENYYKKINNWHCHFSSLPLSSFGSDVKQPMKLKDTNIMFNGEIFNYKDFGNYKSDLHYLKDVFSDGIMTKKFLNEYKYWDGFWSICLVDDNSVLFFTDPVGKKQLYYNELGICSEMKPLINSKFTYTNNEFNTLNTPFDGIKRAMPGIFYIYNYSDSSAIKYNMEVKNFLSMKPKANPLYDLIDNSVLLRSKVNYGKIGLLFSGGLDSSIIAHHLVKNKIDFIAISINNQEKDNAEKISKQIGFNVIYIDDFISNEEIKSCVYMYENYLDYGSLIPQYLLFKKCKELGINTVLTGDGSDELFSGYNRALYEDTFDYDFYSELPYYHLIRIDRISMGFTIEARNPFLSSDIINFAISTSYNDRIGKKILRDIYSCYFDTSIIKKPLRWKSDKESNMELVKNNFLNIFSSK